jgi:protein-S-isoprenylcysteine O-methyltransferase Ste14
MSRSSRTGASEPWWSPPNGDTKLRTTGIYGIVRHPIYLGEVLWPLGLAIVFRSTYGVALTVVWWLAFLIHALAEEAALEEKLGSAYLDYKKKVRGRIFPWLPI